MEPLFRGYGFDWSDFWRRFGVNTNPYGRRHSDGWRKEPTAAQRTAKRAKAKQIRANTKHMRRLAQ